MGTSASYSAPPSWGPLKAEVTRIAGAGVPTPEQIAGVLSTFVGGNGGASGLARGSGGGAGRIARGGPARAVAGRLGAFVSDVRSVGLSEALRRAGLEDLIGKPVGEILNGLLDRLGGSASTLDDVDARTALARVREELLDAATSSEEVERILADQAVNLEQLLEMFFGFYLFEVFCRVFFERLVQRVGETRAQSFLGQILDYVRSALRNRAHGRTLAGISGTETERDALVSDIMESTLRVFGG